MYKQANVNQGKDALGNQIRDYVCRSSYKGFSLVPTAVSVGQGRSSSQLQTLNVKQRMYPVSHTSEQTYCDKVCGSLPPGHTP